MVKAIWEFTHKWFLAAKDTKREAQKPSKGFIYVYVLKKPTKKVFFSCTYQEKAVILCSE
jgi:hypothetical protein